jgi:Fur family peroxide stress response transcriptional regulator
VDQSSGAGQSGAKLTHQRLEIFREIARTGDHPDAPTGYKRVRRRMPTVSQDTVYSTLWWLEEIGLIKTLGTPRDRTRFDANLMHHHHFVCTRCGMIEDFESGELDRIKLPDSVHSIGWAEFTQVEIKGVCLKRAGKK